MRGAEAVSTYAPIPEAEKFRIEYWALEEAKLAADARSRSRWPPASRSSPAPARASAGRSPQRLAAEGACVVVADLDRRQRRGRRRARSADRTSPSAVAVDVTDEAQVAGGVRATRVLAFGGVDLVVNNAGLSISQAAARDHRSPTGTSSTT